MKKKKLFKIIAIIAALFVAFIVVRFPSSYEGKVVDADTGEPVEEAVVLLHWSHASLPHAHYEKYLDAKETLTDKNGFFKTKRRKINLNPLSNTFSPNIIIFKSGYKAIDTAWVLNVFREEHKKWDSPYKKIIDFEGDLVVFKLKKLSTREKRRKNSPHVASGVPYEKRFLLTKEINKERSYLGYDPIK
jgi:hypothetical protein